MYYMRTPAAQLNNDFKAPKRRRPLHTTKDSVSLENSVLI